MYIVSKPNRFTDPQSQFNMKFEKVKTIMQLTKNDNKYANDLS